RRLPVRTLGSTLPIRSLRLRLAAGGLLSALAPISGCRAGCLTITPRRLNLRTLGRLQRRSAGAFAAVAIVTALTLRARSGSPVVRLARLPALLCLVAGLAENVPAPLLKLRQFQSAGIAALLTIAIGPPVTLRPVPLRVISRSRW